MSGVTASTVVPGAATVRADSPISRVMEAVVFGLITVMDAARGPVLDEGELMRFFAESAWYPTALLPGQDDEVVAYHSSGGVSGASGASFCNPRDWFCNDLTLGVGFSARACMARTAATQPESVVTQGTP